MLGWRNHSRLDPAYVIVFGDQNIRGGFWAHVAFSQSRSYRISWVTPKRKNESAIITINVSNTHYIRFYYLENYSIRDISK